MCKIQKTGPWVSTAWKIDLGDKQEGLSVSTQQWLHPSGLLVTSCPYWPPINRSHGWLNNADCIWKARLGSALVNACIQGTWWREMVSEKYLRKKSYLVLLRFSSSMEHPVWNEPQTCQNILYYVTNENQLPCRWNSEFHNSTCLALSITGNCF